MSLLHPSSWGSSASGDACGTGDSSNSHLPTGQVNCNLSFALDMHTAPVKAGIIME